nr:MAG TPA: hypothetical protein [Caudoviricetes sp.]
MLSSTKLFGESHMALALSFWYSLYFSFLSLRVT